MSFISIKDLCFSYDEQEEGKLITNAVDGVSLEIEKGEFVAVIGHNGCGKGGSGAAESRQSARCEHC